MYYLYTLLHIASSIRSFSSYIPFNVSPSYLTNINLVMTVAAKLDEVVEVDSDWMLLVTTSPIRLPLS